MRMKILPPLLASIGLLLLAACGSKATPTPGAVDSLCTAGVSQCVNNATATCNADGRGYTFLECGVDKYCKEGKCLATVCEKGSSKCSGTDSSIVCSENGSESTTVSCTSSQECSYGVCVNKKCGGSVQKCGWKTVLSCTASAWATTQCKANEFCDPATFKCTAQACDTPGASSCQDDTTAQVCNSTGTALSTQACGAGQICDHGLCHLPVTSSGEGDTSGGSDSSVSDAGDVGKDVKQLLELPPQDIILDAPDSFECILSEKKVPPDGTLPQSFSNASVSWLDGLGQLQISGSNDQNQKVEVDVGPIEEFATGSYSKKGAEAPKSRLGYDSGAGAIGGGAFEYEATDYAITIDYFGGPGDRVKGTFSGTLKSSASGKVLYVIDGKFDIKR